MVSFQIDDVHLPLITAVDGADRFHVIMKLHVKNSMVSRTGEFRLSRGRDIAYLDVLP